MSLHLGPIHNWLYKQIRNIENREVKLVEGFAKKYDEKEVANLIDDLREEYGPLKGDTPLEELIGDSHIHPWLEGAITTAQTREAAVVKVLLEKYDDLALLKEIYSKDARQLAQAVGKGNQIDLQTAFELLKNNFLQRMPCDRLSTVVENNDEKQISWRHKKRLHQEFWEAAGVEISLMHQLYSNWIEGFITQLNAKIDYKREFEAEYYEDILEL